MNPQPPDSSAESSPAIPQPPSNSATHATVVVADEKPLSLLTTAGILHHAGMRCICARTADAVMRACGMPRPPSAETLLSDVEEIAGEVARAIEPVRVDQPNPGMHAANPSAKHGNVELIVWDVGNNVHLVLNTLKKIREQFPELPAILLAESKWAGLEKKTEKLTAATRCLFKPIDPSALIAVSEPLLWMPALQSTHRLRGTRPSRPGWVTL
ncbi:hypothetical protein [Aporhodopirellula aestuarii]|uniref:Response regulatory domain-containing protein n=1 Tax=Aporhodopirellula aestuarii TaxID=2950107 RepID=A0ABT0TXK2_9BACT|nr:hypothetical protein [Aporhodopirellula aestuarii]MCM2369327.1 hypothetical protein [Aporhodopirellula aestuarii]